MKATRTDASALLFPAAYRRQVLALLLLHPERKLHVREISRLTGTTAGTMNKELARLHEAGLLERERVGNQLRYSANRSHQIYPELSGILRKTIGVADVLIEALAPLAGSIEVSFIYGSVAKGTETAGSDIDLLVVGSVEFGQVIDSLHGIERKLGREVNPKIFSRREWSARIKAGDAFVSEIRKGPKIMLIGEADEPRKPGRAKP
ncbi:MAG TPA: MarR family transcriptional regulator [Usitatibacter sp.]|jgi:predicted nucleotidyltransferase|nr:MarR family transcriptional regulator [Usitatibacter sp.]